MSTERGILAAMPASNEAADGHDTGASVQRPTTSLCGQMSGLSMRIAPRRRASSKSVVAGQRIVRKYRKFARNLEYGRLKSIVPAVAGKQRPSKVTCILL